ncbi:hypothetical protein Q4485_12260 [Granulosicoccaceae sp. 1_MG-2023]|nr:hypothetical protein [Granulosicoccaceae sp. 1_MG-2023]
MTSTVPEVVRLRDLAPGRLAALLARFGLKLVIQPDGEEITGSYWGEDEAGLVADTLYVRQDTPVHSALHEGCHWICMDDERRAGLHTDAGGDYDEENAVCYLQILLGGALAEMSMTRMAADMDAWGYTFRLGSALAWFREDADDACQWLERRGMLIRITPTRWWLRHVGLVRFA